MSVGAVRTGLQARLRVDRDAFSLDVELAVGAGEVVALLGPNGAGKTTALRALAGLQPLSAGRIEVDGECLDEPGSSTYVATERRSLGFVFQDHLLFPHLSALDNVAFGLRARRVGRAGARAQAAAWLERVGLGAYAGSRPEALSGGQAQRVALARALVTDPRLLLLDEPLAALDASTRMQVRTELRRHLVAYDGATVLVTHDPLDAMVLADRLVVVEGGRVVQRGAPAEVARAPRTAYVARLVGLNLYRGRADGTTVVLPSGATLQVAEPARGDVFVAFAPAAVTLHADRPVVGPRQHCWPGVVESVEQHAAVVRVHLTADPEVVVDVTTPEIAVLGVVPGQRVWAVLDAGAARTYPV